MSTAFKKIQKQEGVFITVTTHITHLEDDEHAY